MKIGKSAARAGRVLLDLDGTLTDPAVGITRSIRHALTALGRPAPPEQALTWCIGPPLHDSLTALLDGDHALAMTGGGPAVMVGDRLHDIDGARANGIPGIGVLWGFGDRVELVAVGADRIVATPDALPAAVRELTPGCAPIVD